MGKTTLLAAALALVALAGCGTTTPGVPTTDAPGPATTSAEGGSGTAFDSLKALSDAVNEKSASAQSAKMTFKSSAAGQEFTGEGAFRFAGEDTAMEMTMTIPQVGEMTMRIVDDLVYMKFPQELVPGKPWVKIDPKSDNEMAKSMGDVIDQAKRTDPRSMLEQLAKSGTIKDFKSDTIDGQETTHYTIEVELSKLGDAELGMDPAAIKELEKAGVKTLTYEVWVNEENLPLRFVTEVPVMNQKVSVQADYTDWGTPVDVEAPPANQVGEMPSY
ncbi:hypothetical protein ACTG9Q_04565 [Actinokineospora sp. 24-640]